MMERANVNPALLIQFSEALTPREEILEAYLFGSRPREGVRTDSDVDVAVYVDEACADDGHWGYQAELTTDLMAMLGTNEVDVVVLNKAPILLYHRVLRDGVRFLSRDLRATTTRLGQALSRYFDFLPQIDKMDAARQYAAGTDPSRPPAAPTPASLTGT